MYALADVSADEKGVVLKDAFKFWVDVRRRAFSVEVMDVDVLEFAGATSITKGFYKTLRDIRNRADMNMVARLDDFDGFSGRNCLILFSHGNYSFTMRLTIFWFSVKTEMK